MKPLAISADKPEDRQAVNAAQRARYGQRMMSPENKEKARLYAREHYQRNKAQIKVIQQRYNKSANGRAVYRDSKLRRRFGISSADYNRLLLAQGSVCAICLQPELWNGGRVLSVDHDHRTNAVRGLLCHNCNVSIGLLGESPDRIRAMAAYIEAHSKGHP